MSTLFTPFAFLDFGPAQLHMEAATPELRQVRAARSAGLKAALRSECPRHPGVYGMIDLHGELVYVGKAKNLRSRLLSYFRPKSRPSKATRIVVQARSIVWENWADEFAALHRELELIRRWRPRCNIQGKPQSWQHTYLCLGRPPAPYAFLSRRPPRQVLASFGPIQSGPRASEAVRRLNDWFRLRDCPQAQEMVFADHHQLFPAPLVPGCLRHELGTCLGPCAGLCSQAAYLRNVRAAQSFLAGADAAPLAELQRAMQEASDRQLFERAAVLRDKLEALSWLHQQLQRMRQAEAMGTALYPVEGHDGSSRWYILHGGRAVAAMAGQRDQERPTASILTLARERGKSAKPADRIAGILLLASWFRRKPAEKDRLVTLGD